MPFARAFAIVVSALLSTVAAAVPARPPAGTVASRPPATRHHGAAVAAVTRTVPPLPAAAAARADTRAALAFIAALDTYATDVALATQPYDWSAVARCETGGDWSMVGSVYSTGLGMMNEAIVEHSRPAVAAAELDGTATVLQIETTADAIAAAHGIRSWGCWAAAYT